MAKIAVDSNPHLLETHEVIVCEGGDVVISPGPFQWSELLCSKRDQTIDFLIEDSEYWRLKYVRLVEERQRDSSI